VLAALYDMGIPIVVVATKVDKVSSSLTSSSSSSSPSASHEELKACLEEIRLGLGLPDGQPLSVSSATGYGCRELWRIILEACEIGVEEFKSQYQEGVGKNARGQVYDDDDGEIDDDQHELERFQDSDDLVYSQGFDWIHDSAVMYEGDTGDFLVDDDDDDSDDIAWQGEEEPDPLTSTPVRESLKSLRKRAKDMERRGEL
jgi:hypothetical protein